MSRNLDQIFIDNPITTNASTDLMYFAQSPYTSSSNNAAMTFANFAAQFSTEGALLKVNNLSDVNSVATSRTNLSVPATSSYAGNPNGHVAGTVGDFVIDTTDSNILYYCITSGTATTAVWIQNADLTGFLQIANNLSDVANVQTSRTNLSVPKVNSFAGNPNGNVAGIIGDLCVDTVDNVTYTCTTAGTTSTAVWTAPSASFDFPAIVITGATTLDSTAFGKTIFCRGAGGYTVTLPLASSQPSVTSGVNTRINFVFQPTTLGQFITVAPQFYAPFGDYMQGPGYNNGSYNYSFGTGETLAVNSDGDVGGHTWTPTVSLQQGYFTAGLNAFVNSSTSLTNVVFDNSIAMTNCMYNNSTGVIAPYYPGRYEISVTLTSLGSTVNYLQSAGFNISGLGNFFAQNTNLANESTQSVVFTTMQYLSGNGQTSGGAGTLTAIFSSTATVRFGGTPVVNQVSVRRVSNY